jgi:hypothetical protein
MKRRSYHLTLLAAAAVAQAGIAFAQAPDNSKPNSATDDCASTAPGQSSPRAALARTQKTRRGVTAA